MRTFEERKAAILRAVDGPRDSNGALTANFQEALAQLYGTPVFFVRRGRTFSKKALAIHKLAIDAGLNGDDLPGRNDLECIAAKKPVSLGVAMRLQDFFAYVEQRGSPELQNWCRHTQPDGSTGFFRIGDNDIIPSCYQLRPGVLKPLREQRGLKKPKLGKILFGDNGEELIDAHEEGAAPYVTYYFAADVHKRLVDWVREANPDFDDYEDPTDLFKRVAQAKMKALLPIHGNVVPD